MGAAFFVILHFMSTWYYSIDGQQFGPISTDEIKNKLSSELPSDTLVWKEGMANWAAARTVTELTFTPQQPMSTPSPYQIPAANTVPRAAQQDAVQAGVNPYVAPVTNTLNVQGGDYPLPYVKPASFGMYVGLLVGGFILMMIGFIIMAASGSGDPSAMSVLVMLAGGGVLCWGAILGLIYVHRAWTVLQPAGASTTPGKAVGFLFIPFFNLYWAFVAYWKWAKEWNEAKPRFVVLHQAPQGAEGVFLGAAICQCVGIVFGGASLVGGILQLVGMKSMCDVINFANQNSSQRSGY